MVLGCGMLWGLERNKMLAIASNRFGVIINLLIGGILLSLSIYYFYYLNYKPILFVLSVVVSSYFLGGGLIQIPYLKKD